MPTTCPSRTAPAHMTSPPARRRIVRRIAITLIAALALAGCGLGSDDGVESVAAPADLQAAAPTPAEPDPEGPAPSPEDQPPAGPAPAIRIARTTDALTVRAEPAADSAVVAELAPTTSFGSPRALLVTGESSRFLQVQVPQRPNDLTGWVAVADVDVVAGTHAVEVDLAARTLQVREGDEVVLETAIAVGTAAAPTPTGTYALVDRLQAPEPGGAYGPFALGIGAYSDTFSEFAGGDGQIGIHGTNDPSSIGQAASHGCVRVPNEVVTTLAEILPLGTPVTIV